MRRKDKRSDCPGQPLMVDRIESQVRHGEPLCVAPATEL